MRPTAIGYGEVNTNVYGTFGLCGDGKWREVRNCLGLRLRADEGIGDNYTLRHAEMEALAIAERNGLPMTGRIPQ